MVTGIKALDPGVTRDNRGKIKDSVTFNLRAPFFHWSWSSQHLFSNVLENKTIHISPSQSNFRDGRRHCK